MTIRAERRVQASSLCEVGVGGGVRDVLSQRYACFLLNLRPSSFDLMSSPVCGRCRGIACSQVVVAGSRQ